MKMRFRIFDILLLGAIVALSLGWTIERSSRVASHKEEIERVRIGSSLASGVWQTSIVLSDLSDGEFTVEERSIRSIWRIWQRLEDVDYALSLQEHPSSAHYIASVALKRLECESASDFFSRATHMKIVEGNEGIFPVFCDESSDDYRSFRRFIDQSLATENDW